MADAINAVLDRFIDDRLVPLLGEAQTMLPPAAGAGRPTTTGTSRTTPVLAAGIRPRGFTGAAAGSRPAPGTIPGQLPVPSVQLPPEATKALHDFLAQLGRNAAENTKRAIEQIRDLLGLPSEEGGDEDEPEQPGLPAPRDGTAKTTPDQPPPPPPPLPPEPPKSPGELPSPSDSRSRGSGRERNIPRGTPDDPVTLPRESKTVNQITAEEFQREFQPEGQIDPKRIGTTQRGISRVVRLDPSDPKSPEFRLERLVESLRSGEVKPEEVEPIRIFEDDGKMFTLDHRRVVAARLAGVQVRYRMARREEVEKELPQKDDREKILDGTIIIRGVPREN